MNEDIRDYELYAMFNQKYKSDLQKRNGFEFFAFLENRGGKDFYVNDKGYDTLKLLFQSYLLSELKGEDHQKKKKLYELLYKVVAEQNNIHLDKLKSNINFYSSSIFDAANYFESEIEILIDCLKDFYDYNTYYSLLHAFTYIKEQSRFL